MWRFCCFAIYSIFMVHSIISSPCSIYCALCHLSLSDRGLHSTELQENWYSVIIWNTKSCLLHPFATTIIALLWEPYQFWSYSLLPLYIVTLYNAPSVSLEFDCWVLDIQHLVCKSSGLQWERRVFRPHCPFNRNRTVCVTCGYCLALILIVCKQGFTNYSYTQADL